jgi:hypothetical protein
MRATSGKLDHNDQAVADREVLRLLIDRDRPAQAEMTNPAIGDDMPRAGLIGVPRWRRAARGMVLAATTNGQNQQQANAYMSPHAPRIASLRRQWHNWRELPGLWLRLFTAHPTDQSS